MSIKSKVNGKVMTVIIDRAQARNAIDRPHADELSRAFREFEADDSLRVAVLWGRGGNFCAGADLKAVASGGKRNRAERDGDGPMGPTRMMLSKPVIAAVEGYAVAGGLELALWCDMRVADETAVFGVFCRRWGVPLIDGGTVRLPRLIGLSRAMDMILTGRGVAADEALSFGLANRVVPAGKARQEAEKIAARLAEFPQVCMNQDRLSACEQFGLSLSDAIGNEFRRGLISLGSPEMARGVMNFAVGAGRHGEFD